MVVIRRHGRAGPNVEGARRDRACAVRPAAVDLAAATLTVASTVIREGDRSLVIQDVLRSDAGQRTIALPPRTGHLLQRRPITLATAEDPPVILSGPYDRPATRARPAVSCSRPRLGRLPWVTSHTFRKTGTTRLDEAGCPPARSPRPPRPRPPRPDQDVYLGRGTASPRTAAVIRRAL